MKRELLIHNEIALILKKNGYPQEGAEYYFDYYLNKIFSWREKKMINPETDIALPSYIEVFNWLLKEGHPICIDWTVGAHIIWDGNTLNNGEIIYSNIYSTPYEVVEELIKKLYE